MAADLNKQIQSSDLATSTINLMDGATTPNPHIIILIEQLVYIVEKMVEHDHDIAMSSGYSNMVGFNGMALPLSEISEGFEEAVHPPVEPFRVGEELHIVAPIASSLTKPPEGESEMETQQPKEHEIDVQMNDSELDQDTGISGILEANHKCTTGTKTEPSEEKDGFMVETVPVQEPEFPTIDEYGVVDQRSVPELERVEQLLMNTEPVERLVGSGQTCQETEVPVTVSKQEEEKTGEDQDCTKQKVLHFQPTTNVGMMDICLSGSYCDNPKLEAKPSEVPQSGQSDNKDYETLTYMQGQDEEFGHIVDSKGITSFTFNEEHSETKMISMTPVHDAKDCRQPIINQELMEMESAANPDHGASDTDELDHEANLNNDFYGLTQVPSYSPDVTESAMDPTLSGVTEGLDHSNTSEAKEMFDETITDSTADVEIESNVETNALLVCSRSSNLTNNSRGENGGASVIDVQVGLEDQCFKPKDVSGVHCVPHECESQKVDNVTDVPSDELSSCLVAEEKQADEPQQGQTDTTNEEVGVDERRGTVDECHLVEDAHEITATNALVISCGLSEIIDFDESNHEGKCVSFASPLTKYHEYRVASQDSFESQSTLDISELLNAEYVDERHLNSEVQHIFEGKLDVQRGQSRNISCPVVEETEAGSNDSKWSRGEIQNVDNSSPCHKLPEFVLLNESLCNTRSVNIGLQNTTKAKEMLNKFEVSDHLQEDIGMINYADSLYSNDSPHDDMKRVAEDELMDEVNPKKPKSLDSLYEEKQYVTVYEDDRASQEVPNEEVVEESDDGEDQAVPSLGDGCDVSSKHFSLTAPGGHGNFGSGATSWQYSTTNSGFPSGESMIDGSANELPSIQPLQTCRKPFRTGLSKRQRVSRLHPYYRPKTS